MACLRELRAELSRSYPSVSWSRLRAVLRRRGLTRFPEPFLVGDPRDEGLDRRAARVARGLARGRAPAPRPHPLFSAAYYLAANPDVAASRVDPWLHYQVMGRVEGRSPHPLIAPARLAEQIPDALPGEVLDRYLLDRSHWLASPGPHVDAERFVLEGPWDPSGNPLLQIAARYPVDPWVRARLRVIDLADSAHPVDAALGVLVAAHPEARVSASRWSRRPATGSVTGRVLVVPGLVLATPEAEVASASATALSADATVVRTRELILSLDLVSARRASRLVFVRGPLDPSELAVIASALPADGLVAPFDAAQAADFATLGAEVLAVGRQAIVDAGEVEIAGSPADPPAASIPVAHTAPRGSGVVGVISTRDQERWIASAVESLRPEVDRLIVVDDGSADATPRILADLAERLDLRVLRHDRSLGVSESYNEAVAEAAGEIVLIQGGDDRTLPGRRARSVEALADAAVALVHSAPVVIGADDETLPDRAAEEFAAGATVGDPLAYLYATGNFICAPTVAVRSDDYLAAGGFPPGIDLLQDYALWLELARRGRFERLDEPVVAYRKHAANLSREYVGVDTLRRRRHASEFVAVRDAFLDRADSATLARLGPVAGVGPATTRDEHAMLLRLADADRALVRRGVDQLLAVLAREGTSALARFGLERADLDHLAARADEDGLTELARASAVLHALNEAP